jgi:hypothetical protein
VFRAQGTPVRLPWQPRVAFSTALKGCFAFSRYQLLVSVKYTCRKQRKLLLINWAGKRELLAPLATLQTAPA